MPDTLLWNARQIKKLMWDGEDKLLYRPSGPFTGDMGIIRASGVALGGEGTDRVPGYWRESISNTWRPVPDTGLGAFAEDNIARPVALMADGRIFLRNTGSILFPQFWEFDPAECLWTPRTEGGSGLSGGTLLIGGEPMFFGPNLGDPVYRWDGTAWIVHSNPTSDLALDVFAPTGAKSLAGLPAIVGRFRNLIDNKWTRVIVWTGFGWASAMEWSPISESVSPKKAVSIGGSIYALGSSGVTLFVTEPFGATTVRGFRPLLDDPLIVPQILAAGSFNGALYVMGLFDELLIEGQSFSGLSNIAAVDVSALTASSPGLGITYDQIPVDNQLITAEGLLWVSAPRLHTADLLPVPTTTRMAIWNGFGWTLPPAPPQGGTFTVGDLIAPGDPF